MLECLMSQRTRPGRLLSLSVISRRAALRRFKSCAVCASVAALLLAAGVGAMRQQDRVAEYKEKYERETDPVRKARALVKYGDWQVREFIRQADANEFDSAFATLAVYRNEVRTTFDALKAKVSDPERKPEGFKDLQIHLRDVLFRLDRSVTLIPLGRRPVFQDIRDELGRIHNELNHMLFPRVPGGNGK
jgi:hypothetical protein